MATSGTILHVQDVTVAFDGFTVLDNLDFRLDYGELHFLIGPNGAGKTTLLDVITGKTRPLSGHVAFDGHADVQRWPEYRLVRQGIGRKFQTPTIFNSLTVQENLEAAVGTQTEAVTFWRKLPHGRETIDETLELIGLRRRATQRAGLLSHGQKQWLEIGMLLARQPKLLLLDEPVAGMTRPERDRTGELLRETARRRSVIVVEHDMEFVRRFASTVTVLHMGKVLCAGPVEAIQRDPRVIEVYLGRGHSAAARRSDKEHA